MITQSLQRDDLISQVKYDQLLDDDPFVFS